MTSDEDGRVGTRARTLRARASRADRRLLALAGAVLLLGAAWLVYVALDGNGEADESGFSGLGSVGAPSVSPAPAEEPPSGRDAVDADAGEGMAFERDGTTAGSGDGGTTSLNLAGRTIIRSGSLDLHVEEVDTSYHRVQQIATSAGGFVADSTFTGSDDQQRATLTVRVPADRFQSVVDELRDLAIEVRSVSTSAQDVTEEVTDLQSTLRNLRAVEAQYIELLSRANEIRDVLQVQEHLNSVRGQIERVEGRTQMLEDLAELATLTVSLRPATEATVAPPAGGIGQAISDAWAASLRSIEAVATVVLVAIVYSWWLLPAFVLLAVLVRRWLRTPRALEPGGEAGGGGA